MNKIPYNYSEINKKPEVSTYSNPKKNKKFFESYRSIFKAKGLKYQEETHFTTN